VNWGWAIVPPASTQTLPREITFNIAARLLQQYPIEEMKKLRISQDKHNYFDISISADDALIRLPKKSNAPFPAQSEIVATFTLPTEEATFGITIDFLACNFTYRPPPSSVQDDWAYYEIPVFCGNTNDTVRLLRDEKAVELRLFADWTFVETYFAQGRTVITEVPPVAFQADSVMKVTSTTPINVTVEAYALRSIWVNPEEIRKSPRIYPSSQDNMLDKT
jgi:sucrose-6-phosphate hydrolase SacC (GH32 family)